jgi:methyltransferase
LPVPHDLIGTPQVAALLVLLQRGAEELHSARNTRRLMAAGAVEVGREYYPVVAVTHLAWIAAVFLLLPADAPLLLFPLVLYLALQIARYWVIATLGSYWTHRIIVPSDAPLVRRGPYRYMRHPNYAVTIAETLLLPMVFAGWALGIIMAAVWSAVIYYKIVLENRALAGRTAALEAHNSAATK